jgi:hypothetical protein
MVGHDHFLPSSEMKRTLTNINFWQCYFLIYRLNVCNIDMLHNFNVLHSSTVCYGSTGEILLKLLVLFNASGTDNKMSISSFLFIDLSLFTVATSSSEHKWS